MSRRPLPLVVLLQRFHRKKRPGQIVFCKPYKAEDIWDIGVGAVLDLYRDPHPRLVAICQKLYAEDPSWFEGDIVFLLSFDPDMLPSYIQDYL